MARDLWMEIRLRACRAKGASIVCFDKAQRKENWKALDDEAAYSSFLVGTLAGVKQLVALTADALVGVDLKPANNCGARRSKRRPSATLLHR
jgi:hypothetical protein